MHGSLPTVALWLRISARDLWSGPTTSQPSATSVALPDQPWWHLPLPMTVEIRLTTSATFTIEDTTAPDITTLASDLTVECDGAGNVAELNAWLAANGGAVASDICSGSVVWTNNFTTLSDLCGATGSALVVFTATDDCGNTSTTSATFTIEDTTAPDITTLASDLTVECDGAGNVAELNAWLAANGGAVASDICSGSVVWTNNFTTLSDLCGATGSALVVFTATDDCGNTSTTSATFTIEDTTAPDITTLASDLTVECDGAGNAAELNAWLAANGGAVASDICSGSVVWTNNFTTLSDLCGTTGSALVVFTATDDCGNTSTTSATFTIEDTTAPDITTLASDLTVECDGAGNAAELNAWLAANGGAVASDICSGSVVWTNNFTTLSDLCGATGSALVVFTATDDCGNTSTTSATFTIEDTTAPDITTLASDLTVECDGAGNVAELNAWLAANGGAVASDICSGSWFGPTTLQPSATSVVLPDQLWWYLLLPMTVEILPLLRLPSPSKILLLLISQHLLRISLLNATVPET